MARAKRTSDEVYNARRRAKRLLARLEREDVSGMSESQKRARADYIASVREQIAQSYQGTRQVPEAQTRTKEAAERLDRMTTAPRKARSRDARSNLIFQRQINLARSGAPSTLGDSGKEAVSVFYAATRRFWRGKDPKERNRQIMEGLGVTSLSEAYDRVIGANGKALDSAVSAGAQTSLIEGLTSENEDFYGEVDFDAELTGSTVWASKLVMFG
jgi:hypothetical protein|nr:MAG TPA: hypothetical protein [Bacteriophage sp.]